MARRTRSGSFSVGLLGALLLHATALLLLGRIDVPTTPAAQVAEPDSADAFFSLEELLPVGERDDAPAAQAPAGERGNAAGASVPEATDEPTGALAGGTSRAKTLGAIKALPAPALTPRIAGTDAMAGEGDGPPASSASVEPVPAGSTDSPPTKAPVRFSLTAGEAQGVIAKAGSGRARASERQRGNDVPLSKRVERLLQDEQDNHDRKVGLGPGGVVVVALEAAAAQGGRAPQEGRATFDVFAGPDGQVNRVELSGASGDTADWTAVAKAAFANLKGRQLKVSKGARGVRVRVALTARVAYPSGAKHRVSLRVPFLKRSDAPPEAPEKSEPITTRNQEPPKPLNPYFWWESVPELSRLQLDRLPMPMVGVGFDPVDLLAPQSRVLTSVVLDEQPL